MEFDNAEYVKTFRRLVALEAAKELEELRSSDGVTTFEWETDGFLGLVERFGLNLEDRDSSTRLITDTYELLALVAGGLHNAMHELPREGDTYKALDGVNDSIDELRIRLLEALSNIC